MVGTVAALLLMALLPMILAAGLIIYLVLRYRRPVAEAPRPPAETGEEGPAVKTMSEIMARLRAEPFRSVMPSSLAALIVAALNAMPMVLGNLRPTAGLVYPFPSCFEPVILQSQDGTPVCGLLALQPGTRQRPAIIFVHGLFSNKNTYGLLSLATRAFYDWGFQVLALDLRNFGDSSRFSEAPTSWGFRESDDVLAAADYLTTIEQVSTVGACGMSMGAASVLLAASRSRPDHPLNGGVVAVGGYADAGRIVKYISTAGYSAGRLFTALTFRLLTLFKTVCCGPRAISDLRRYTREVSGQYYEMGTEELFRKASPVKRIVESEVPCLIIHALDDFIVPPDEAEKLLAAARDNPMVDALLTPSGGHACYEFCGRRWFHATLERFFSYWGEFGQGSDDSYLDVNSVGFSSADN